MQKLDPTEYGSDPDAAPLNPLPWVVVVLALAIGGVELVLLAASNGVVGGAAGVGWRLDALTDWAFYEPQFDWMLEHRQLRPDFAVRMLTYPFIQPSFTSAAFAIVFLLALGKAVGEVFPWWALLVLFFASSIVGAIAYGLVVDTRVVLAGAFPAAYGFIGAFSFLLWTNLAGTGAHRLRAFSLIGLLMGLQLLWALLFGQNPTWIAELAGFATGFLLSFVLVPGGWARVVARLRTR